MIAGPAHYHFLRVHVQRGPRHPALFLLHECVYQLPLHSLLALELRPEGTPARLPAQGALQQQRLQLLRVPFPVEVVVPKKKTLNPLSISLNPLQDDPKKTQNPPLQGVFEENWRGSSYTGAMGFGAELEWLSSVSNRSILLCAALGGIFRLPVWECSSSLTSVRPTVADGFLHCLDSRRLSRQLAIPTKM